MSHINYHSTKKGVASFYVVIFATILFGVITLSFVRIILSESGQSSNDDLSQSAYDSALVGVEDAKRAVDEYYECMDRTGSATQCTQEHNGNPLFGGDCDTFYLREWLYPNAPDGEVLVEESTTNNSNQAYTCVILSNSVPDYRSTLTADTPTRVVPIGIGSTSLNNVKTIKFQWYSEVNGTEFRNLNHGGSLANKNNSTTPPVISLTLIQTDSTIDLSSFNNSTSTRYSTMVLLPSESGVNSIDSNQIGAAGNSDKGSANEPFEIKCEHNEFACTVELTGLNLTQGGNAMLVVSMPYGDLVTDFAVTLQQADGSSINFENVQVSVDSTGRANQLLRRVETRLDPADIFFPYPQYEIELGGTGSDTLSKYFWITANCWTENGPCDNNGSL